MTALGLSGKIGLGRASLTAPRRHAVALAVATGLIGIAWSLASIGLPGFSKERVFNFHPPLMMTATFLLLPLSMRLVTTSGPVVHVALNAAAATAAVAGVVAAAVAHSRAREANLYSAHSWVGVGALALMAVAAVLGATGRHEMHRRVARVAAGALFSAAALGFASAQTRLLHTTETGPTTPYESGALAAALLCALSLAVGATVLSGNDGLLRRAVSVRTDVTVPISDGDSSGGNDIVLYELDEAAGMGSAGMGAPGASGHLAAGNAARAAAHVQRDDVGRSPQAGPSKPPVAPPAARAATSAEAAATAALRVLGLLPGDCGAEVRSAREARAAGRVGVEQAVVVGEAAV